jgi:cytochrome c-type biogenesis protein CcmH
MKARWLPLPAACVALGALLAVAFVSTTAHAAPATDTAADPTLESRVNTLAAELRCLVCQNQSLADSHAELALDLKQQVREQLRAGRSEAQVVDYMTSRYGDFVLYRPPFKATTFLLWLGPALLLTGAGAMLWRSLSRADAHPDAEALSTEDAARADALLATPGSDGAGASGRGARRKVDPAA